MVGKHLGRCALAIVILGCMVLSYDLPAQGGIYPSESLKVESLSGSECAVTNSLNSLVYEILGRLDPYQGAVWNRSMWRRNRHYLAHGADISRRRCEEWKQTWSGLFGDSAGDIAELSRWIHVLYASAYDSIHNAARRRYGDYSAAVRQYNYAKRHICEILRSMEPKCSCDIPNRLAQWPGGGYHDPRVPLRHIDNPPPVRPSPDGWPGPGGVNVIR